MAKIDPNNITVAVYLVGNTSDKIAFLKSCGEVNQGHSIHGDGWGERNCFATAHYKGIAFKIIHNLLIKNEAYSEKYVGIRQLWQNMDIEDVEDRALSNNYFPEGTINFAVDSLLYLNASQEDKKKHEAMKNCETCTSYDYKSEDFPDALNCLENIAPASADKLYNGKQYTFLGAQAMDDKSLPGILPKEVAYTISHLYATLSNRTILLFKPQPMEIPPAQLVLDNKIERKKKEESKISQAQAQDKNETSWCPIQ
jgi:hypothetical protein